MTRLLNDKVRQHSTPFPAKASHPPSTKTDTKSGNTPRHSQPRHLTLPPQKQIQSQATLHAIPSQGISPSLHKNRYKVRQHSTPFPAKASHPPSTKTDTKSGNTPRHSQPRHLTLPPQKQIQSQATLHAIPSQGISPSLHRIDTKSGNTPRHSPPRHLTLPPQKQIQSQATLHAIPSQGISPSLHKNRYKVRQHSTPFPAKASHPPSTKTDTKSGNTPRHSQPRHLTLPPQKQIQSQATLHAIPRQGISPSLHKNRYKVRQHSTPFPAKASHPPSTE